MLSHRFVLFRKDCKRYGKTFRRGARNVARPANRSPSVEPRTVETVKTCAVPHPETKGKLRPANSRVQEPHSCSNITILLIDRGLAKKRRKLVRTPAFVNE